MRRVIEYLRAHPVIAVALAVGVVGGLVLALTAPPPPPTTTEVMPAAPVAVATPAPPQVAQPVPTPTPAPVPTPSPRVVAGPVDAGRPDPFAPLVRAETGAGVERPGPVPPPAPLPPPLFPGQTPLQPGATPTPAPPPKEASTAELVGILGDGAGTAIIKVGDKTYIVSRGDVILDKIRVTAVDIAKRLVILEQDGERFELKMGGVSHRHVAATAPSSIS
ncbi:MAG: hypothetical protein FJX73_11905 [Armatimonadetes bacterium]|nr:hypothetical protein [Armatimonadota bacterium]